MCENGVNVSKKWIVIGIGGVTCGGKTTLAKRLHQALPNNSVLLSQDDYFYECDDPRHTWIPELNHVNFDIMSSLDMAKMEQDASTILQQPQIINTKDKNGESENQHQVQRINVLILEGFCILNYAPIYQLCDFRYFFALDKDVCERRRAARIYEPPDCPGYFDKCAWPEYLKQYAEVKSLIGVTYLDQDLEKSVRDVMATLDDVLKTSDSPSC